MDSPNTWSNISRYLVLEIDTAEGGKSGKGGKKGQQKDGLEQRWLQGYVPRNMEEELAKALISATCHVFHMGVLVGFIEANAGRTVLHELNESLHRTSTHGLIAREPYIKIA